MDAEPNLRELITVRRAELEAQVEKLNQQLQATREELQELTTTPGAFPRTALERCCRVRADRCVHGLISDVWATHSLVRPFLGTGVLGGFTPFPTYAVDVQHGGARVTGADSGGDAGGRVECGMGRTQPDRIEADMTISTTPPTRSWLRVMVFTGESDLWNRKPVFSEIVHRARKAGLAGASVFRGMEGFGASSLIHTTRLLSLSDDLPVAVVIVDDESRVRAFLPQLAEVVGDGLVVLDQVEVMRQAEEKHRR
jgi:PII-like signaling protein